MKQGKDKHYITAKESRDIAKNNRKMIRLLQKRRGSYKREDYVTQMRDDKNIVEFENLHTYFFTDSGTSKAVNGVSFDIPQGSTVGVVGESGCGKSVTSLSLMQLVQGPAGQIVEGSIRFKSYDFKRDAKGKPIPVWDDDAEGNPTYEPKLEKRGKRILVDKADAKRMRKGVLPETAEEIAAKKSSEAVEPLGKTDPSAIESKFTGGALMNFLLGFLTVVVTIFSLGIAYPFMMCWHVQWQTEHTYYDGKKLVFNGNAVELFKKFIIWWLLSIVTIGIYTIWADVKLMRWKVQHTHFEGMNGDSQFDGTVGDVFAIGVLCSLAMYFSVGLAWFWAHCYRQRYYIQHTIIDGKRMQFDGYTSEFFHETIIPVVLSIVTLGIYSIWLDVKVLNWTAYFTHSQELLAEKVYVLKRDPVFGKDGKPVMVRKQKRDENGILQFEMEDRVFDIAKMPLRDMPPLRGRQIAMIFQEPMTSLNPVFTIGSQLDEVTLLHVPGSSKEEARNRSIEMLELVGIAMPDHVYRSYPHELSGGMRQRVMIAMALCCNPRLIIADEPTTALDVTIQAQILDLLRAVKQKMSGSIMLITHDLGVIAEMVDYVVVMYAGRVVEKGTVEEIFKNPTHPYTIGLQKSKPVVRRKVDRLYSIPGNVPNPINMPSYCYFRDRCDRACGKCGGEYPPVIQLSPTHFVSCWRAEEIAGEREQASAEQAAQPKKGGKKITEEKK